MKHYEFHPIADEFPLEDQGPEFDAFVQDIKVNNLQQPIILHQGKILDGRRRYLACKQAGVSPKFGEWDGTGSPLDFVVSLNLHRRHLTPSQRAVIGLTLLEEETRRAKERQRLSKGRGKKGAQRCATLNGKAMAQAAQRIGCSPRLIEQVKRVYTESPKLIREIATGTLTVAAAAASLKPESSMVLSKTRTPPSVCYWIWMTLTRAGYAPPCHCRQGEVNNASFPQMLGWPNLPTSVASHPSRRHQRDGWRSSRPPL